MPQRVGRAIELARAIVAPADDRAHEAVGLRDHCRSLMRVKGRRVDAQLILDDAFSLELQVRVETGSHDQHAIVAELPLLGERLDLVVGEIEIPIGTAMFGVIDGGRGIAPGRINLPLGHEAGVDEVAQDVVGPRARRRQIDVRRVLRRRLEQPGEHRRLGQIDVAGGLAEIILRRRLHAERAASHVGAIEIEAEDLFLGQMMFEPEREVRFLDLARDRTLVGQEHILGELLGDRGAPLHDASGVRIDGERAQRPDHVDAEVAEEAPILGGENRLDEMVGQFVERDRVVMLDAAPPDFGAIAIEERHRQIRALQPVLVAGVPERRLRQREGENQADDADVEALARELDREFSQPGQAKAVGKRADRL